MLPKSLRQASSILSSLVVALLIIDKIFCASEAYPASRELILAISPFVGDFRINFRKSSSEIFCLRFDHMVAIPMINTGPMNKKTAVKVKKGMTPEELSNDKLDMIRRSNFIEILLVDQVF
ncbi:uncharacterized protein OCT59_029469 [Rhizophagus irregularis]|uniref:uncharacterized protein n=1 Tax=Rhizophagus irregularis TaxID=588596 RepID=UPI001A0745A6|nr:hypothetical protein OCT59_029469 [Rhizophagus irregularis]GBC49025.2 hypothetical protein GLOIN_2v1639548 [Rhizophagus irregularis DAOM 181602=DAOM 197198]